MEAKIILRKGPLRKILHLTGRKVVTHDYFPRPLIAEEAYRTMRDTWINKRNWTIEVKQKEKRIIVPGTEGAEILPRNEVMRLKTRYR